MKIDRVDSLPRLKSPIGVTSLVLLQKVLYSLSNTKAHKLSQWCLQMSAAHLQVPQCQCQCQCQCQRQRERQCQALDTLPSDTKARHWHKAVPVPAPVSVSVPVPGTGHPPLRHQGEGWAGNVASSAAHGPSARLPTSIRVRTRGELTESRIVVSVSRCQIPGGNPCLRAEHLPSPPLPSPHHQPT